MMTAIYRPNSSWGPPQSVAPQPNQRMVTERLNYFTPVNQVWTRKDDLSLAQAACRGKSVADISAIARTSEGAVRMRWTAMKQAACTEGQPFGLSEQEALLIALQSLAVQS